MEPIQHEMVALRWDEWAPARRAKKAPARKPAAAKKPPRRKAHAAS